jgi:L-lysine exporter family protein LysE/ArgO
VSIALHGLLAGLSLIIAIGSQNVFVLRQGIRREHVLAVVTVCIASDVVLISAGACGLGALVQAAPGVVGAARWAGVAFLLGYAVLAARRAVRGGESLEADGSGRSGARRGSGLGAVIATTLAITWLNPHVYLDTVLLLGSIASTHGARAWLFVLGALAGSVLWFSALGFGARHLGRVLSGARSWRVLDGVVAGTMVVVAGMLVVG